MNQQTLPRSFAPLLAALLLTLALADPTPAHAQLMPTLADSMPAQAQQPGARQPGQIAASQVSTGQSPLMFKVDRSNQRLEMTVNTSRRLQLNQKIPEAQVNNPSIVGLVPLSENTIQVTAQTPGVTQINIWGEDGTIFTIDVIVHADVQELDVLLKTQFPNASLKVIPIAQGVMISGFVDQPEQIELVIQIASQYFPNVINNMKVSGVRQVLLDVKLMEVSRTKLRSLGFDFAKLTGPNTVVSGAAGLIGGIEDGALATSGKENFVFQVLTANSQFFGVLEALRDDKLGKILAEPKIVAISGRPSYFRVGGEVGYQLDGGITGASAAFKEYGTRVDLVAIVLGNSRIRLEVRVSISGLDPANASGGIPALRLREVDTGVEMQAGQTLAIAGLIQNRVESYNRGFPWISEVPYLGMLFRRVENENNEVELLIMVTPELVDAMDAEDVPKWGPGMKTTNPSDWELYAYGHLEVPNCCDGSGCQQCRQGGDPGMDGIPPGGIILEEREDPRASYDRYTPRKPRISQADSRSDRQIAEPGFIGPIGYDVVK